MYLLMQLRFIKTENNIVKLHCRNRKRKGREKKIRSCQSQICFSNKGIRNKWATKKQGRSFAIDIALDPNALLKTHIYTTAHTEAKAATQELEIFKVYIRYSCHADYYIMHPIKKKIFLNSCIKGQWVGRTGQ